MKAVGSTVAALILTGALAGGGLLHAVIPHHHGDDHGDGHGNESAMWTDLHGALNHEDKKILSAALSSPMLVILAVVISVMTTGLGATFLRHRVLVARSRDPNAGELLRRGIHKYRAFA